ncbi:hypothetical protein QEN19_003549 [Hanseniaspora menglaensis]
MATTSKTSGTSTQQVITSIITNLIIFAVFLVIFLVLKERQPRIYRPKTLTKDGVEPLSRSYFGWILQLLHKSDRFILQQAGLDGYFFTRYLVIISLYCGASMLYVFPILFPVNAAHGNGNSGLDQLSFGDVKDKGRYYAHVFVGWVFFWSFLYIIYRELTYFTAMRQVVLTSKKYATKKSERTVLLQNVPQKYLQESEIRKLFVGIKNVYITRAAPELDTKVKERTKLANKLENILNGYISKACKTINKKKLSYTYAEDNDQIYDIVKKRPSHKDKFLIGKKIDSIDFLLEKIPELNTEIEELQNSHEENKPWNSVFIEFESQYHAQVAKQTNLSSIPLALTPKSVGVEPQDVVWFNMRMVWWERMGRRTACVSAIIALVILWTIPVAFVGMISQITYLTKKLPWLDFINSLPKVLLGILTALAPTIALAVLMMLLPIFIRKMAVVQGAVSSQSIEYFTQQSYFAFQVIQVFLVTTIASSATSTVTQIIDKPSDAMTLLASNLPKSSNFFVAYIILQGLSGASGVIAQIVGLIVYHLLGMFLDKTVRKQYNRFFSLPSVQFGTTFPVFTNLAVIIFSYALISPIILLFGFVGFFILYVAYLYNFCFVYEQKTDSKGVHYPRALYQTIVGLYLGQICMLGLFVVGKGWGPIVLQLICLLVTAFVHINMTSSFDYLNENVIPLECMLAKDGKSSTYSYKNVANFNNSSSENIKELPTKYTMRKYTKNTNKQDSSTLAKSIQTDMTYEQPSSIIQENENSIQAIPLLADISETLIDENSVPYYKRFFQPHIFKSYAYCKQKLPLSYMQEDPIDPKTHVDNYNLPSVSDKCPLIWLPKDQYGFSDHFVKLVSSKGIECTDMGGVINEKGKCEWIKGCEPGMQPVDELENDVFADKNALEDEDVWESKSSIV